MNKMANELGEKEVKILIQIYIKEVTRQIK
jgi:hypothetical protein